MKKAITLLLVLLLSFGICACGKSEQKPNGKYLYEKMDNVYYEFKDNDTCYLVAEPLNSKSTYKYVINYEVNEDEELENCCVVHISDVNSKSVQKLVYDFDNDTIYDPQFGLFIKE